MDWHLRLPGALYRQARARAGDDRSLAALVQQWLAAYVAGTTEAQRVASLGGHARRDQLTPARRAAIATQAARARWHPPPETD